MENDSNKECFLNNLLKIYKVKDKITKLQITQLFKWPLNTKKKIKTEQRQLNHKIFFNKLNLLDETNLIIKSVSTLTYRKILTMNLYGLINKL